MAASSLSSVQNKCLFRYFSKHWSKCLIQSTQRHASNVEGLGHHKPSTFGMLFDIDGVIVRGKRVIPKVSEAFKRLTDDQGNFRVPTVFVTNAGSSLSKEKADQLSDWLGIKVTQDRVVMSHTPLKTFTNYHEKCVLVSGQGPVEEIARRLGFNKVYTIEDLRKAFPLLDAVDHRRRISADAIYEATGFPKIEAVILFGEPIRWETTLQLILDVLMTDGLPSQPKKLSYPHIPVLACNMDLQWMAEANIPRFGHGAFLVCLEELYKKVTGKDLIYSALVGKPSEITYRYAHQLILNQAREIGNLNDIRRLYAVGDNINTDIFGANLYNKYLSSIKGEEKLVKPLSGSLTKISNHIEITSGNISSCHSVLVKTGVFTHEISDSLLDHSPRDFLGYDKTYRQPILTLEDAADAIDKIFELEEFH